MDHDFLLHQNTITVYISITNIVYPLTVITFELFLNILLGLKTIIFASLTAFIFTFEVVLREGFKFVNNLTMKERIMLCLCVYNFISQYFLEISYNNKEAQLQDKIKTIEKKHKIIKNEE